MNLRNKLPGLKKRYQEQSSAQERSLKANFVGPIGQQIRQTRFNFQIAFGADPSILTLDHASALGLLQELNIALKGSSASLTRLPGEYSGMRVVESAEPGIRVFADGEWSGDPENIGARAVDRYDPE